MIFDIHICRDVQAERSTRETKDVCVSKQLSCCADCSENFDKEVQSIPSSTNIQHKSSLPSWLQKYREETTRNTLKIDQVNFSLFNIINLGQFSNLEHFCVGQCYTN